MSSGDKSTKTTHPQLVRRVAIRIDYAPSLSVFSQMDAAAMGLASDFPDWNRKPLQVDLRNGDRRHAMIITHNHCYFEATGGEHSGDDIAAGIRVINQVANRLSVTTLIRAGIAVVCVFEEEDKYDDLVLLFDRKIHQPFTLIPALNGQVLVDLSYLVIVRDAQGDQWTRNLSFSPMTREQWFEHHPLTVQPKELENRCVADFKARVPEVFSYVSADAFIKDIEKNTAIKEMEAVAKKSISVANQLYTYLHA